MKILIGACGSVAISQLPSIFKTLIAHGHEVKIITTPEAYKMLDDGYYFLNVPPVNGPKLKQVIFGGCIYRKDLPWHKKGDPIVHIDLGKWADVMLLAPLTANTLAKIANGLADNLLTNTVRAWNYTKPFVMAPAMNTFMYENPLTQKHIETMKSFSSNVKLIEPQCKKLACGDTGIGALAEVDSIVSFINAL